MSGMSRKSVKSAYSGVLNFPDSLRVPEVFVKCYYRNELTTMIGHEENQEDVSFKVTDRRKFNPDGSVREGVVIDEPKPAPAAAPETKSAAAPAKAAPELPAESAAEVDDESEDDDIPGADDPASFVKFLSTLATN